MEPPLSDKEMVTMFLSTLQHPFYEHMVGIVSYKFANIVIIGERVEAGIRSGRICTSMIANINEFGSQSGEKKEKLTLLHNPYATLILIIIRVKTLIRPIIKSLLI